MGNDVLLFETNGRAPPQNLSCLLGWVTAVTLESLDRLARAVGKQVRIEFA
ncbi:MAG: hypothetical protein HND44_03295 [Chloroflexi bacterium]|nr:hypothetical protein [Ardenticatenaceae bacterium]NOG33589.1 hypothetical protein [Chloroflexota bacterium]